jgi:uncharacterized protein (DUF433 family)
MQQIEPASGYVTTIERDPEVLGGKPIVAGTRIGVHDLVAYVRAYHGDLGRILAEFPQLRLEQIADALAYFTIHPVEIEAILTERRRLYDAGLARPEGQE